MELEISSILETTDWRLSSVRSLYQEAFPLAERKPANFLDEVINRDDYRLLAATMNKKVAGFAIIYISSFNYSLLEYMAIDERLRGGGCGSKLFNQVCRCAPHPLVLEVEAPTGLSSSSVENRRIDFYRRLGCVVVPNLIYHMPSVSTDAPPPMWLMLYGLNSQILLKSKLRIWMIDWFEHVYRRKDGEADIDEMLSFSPEGFVIGD